MKLKSLFLGIVIIIVLGLGSLLYRNALEHPNKPVACPLDARICPDGTAVGRTGISCTFPPCPPPNVTLDAANIAYAVPAGYEPIPLPDTASLAAYGMPAASSTAGARIVIRRYAIDASSTPLATIQATAIGGSSALPVPATAYSTATIAGREYTVVSIERFEGIVDTAYYLARPGRGDVLRFDAIDENVADWTNPQLDVTALPAEAAVRQLLAGLQSS